MCQRIEIRVIGTTFQKSAGGNSSIIGDAANWPAMEGRSLSGYQQKRVWINDGAGRYNDVAQAVGATRALTTDAQSHLPISGIAACSM